MVKLLLFVSLWTGGFIAGANMKYSTMAREAMNDHWQVISKPRLRLHRKIILWESIFHAASFCTLTLAGVQAVFFAPPDLVDLLHIGLLTVMVVMNGYMIESRMQMDLAQLDLLMISLKMHYAPRSSSEARAYSARLQEAHEYRRETVNMMLGAMVRRLIRSIR